MRIKPKPVSSIKSCLARSKPSRLLLLMGHFNKLQSIPNYDKTFNNRPLFLSAAIKGKKLNKHFLLVGASTFPRSACIQPAENHRTFYLFMNAAVTTVRVQIHAIQFNFTEAGIRIFQMRITVWRKCNQNRWHSFLWFTADCISELLVTDKDLSENSLLNASGNPCRFNFEKYFFSNNNSISTQKSFLCFVLKP